MIVCNRRAITATILAGVVTAAGFLTTAPGAHADPVASGTVTITGDPGDPVTGGASYSYDVAAGDHLSINSDETRNGVYVAVAGANGDSWSIWLAAPDGQQLAVGSYPDAESGPWYEGRPARADIAGMAGDCEVPYSRTGSFVIADISFGPGGYVERLDATFEQHCDHGEPALRGRVVIGNPPPPPPLEITLAVAADGVFSKLNGKATVHGTVGCNRDATVHISGQITQVKKQLLIEGYFGTKVDCVAGETAQWSGTAPLPQGTAPFQKGRVEVTGSAGASVNGESVRVELVPTKVTLTPAKPVVVGDPPPPAPGEFALAVAADGVFSKLNGKATVHGTVVCDLDATVEIGGMITQVKDVILFGHFSTAVDCVKGETAQWSGTATGTGTTPFQKGQIEVTAGGSASDSDGNPVRVEFGPTTVTLTRASAAVEARM